MAKNDEWLEKLMKHLVEQPQSALTKEMVAHYKAKIDALVATLTADEVHFCRHAGRDLAAFAIARASERADQAVVDKLSPDQKVILETMRGSTVPEMAAAARANGWAR